MIADRYGHPAIAERHLEQVVNAVLRTSFPRRGRPARPGLDRGPRPARRAGLPALPRPGLRDARVPRPTSSRPRRSSEIAQLKIGSRPARRGESTAASSTSGRSPGSSAGCRAGTRCPAGTAWAAPSTSTSPSTPERPGDARRRCTARWPFWQTLIDNAQMILAKADMTIARLYADLVEDQALADRIFGRIAAEYRRTVDVDLPDHRPGRRCSSRSPILAALDPAPQPLRRSAQLHPARPALKRLRAGDEPARGPARPACWRASTASPRA